VRPIHHLVLPVTTLNLARGRLDHLGFTVAPDARHPFGTGNCCVFFANGTYLEALALADRDAADRAAAEGLYFVQRTKRFLERRGEGFAMLALRTGDAEAVQAEFEETGVSAGPLFRFTRMATLPDGSEHEIGVVLAYAGSSDAPDATIFACEPIAAERLWDPAYTAHPNSAAGVTGVTAIAENPADFADFLSATTGQDRIAATDDGVSADLPGGTVSILSPAGFLDRYGVKGPDPRHGLILAGFDVAAGDPDRAGSYAGPTAIRRGDDIVVPPAPGLTAVLCFRSIENG
jgi:hypothetical protein